MTRAFTVLISTGAAALALIAAGQPSALAQVQPGLWEISGVPGTSAPVRQCVADAAALVRFEHRGKSCNANLLKSAASLANFEYHCGPAGFGNSEVTVLTPRSLRISTQGISDGLPFNYVLQARRVGDCPLSMRH
jgi:hypothetical protein